MVSRPTAAAVSASISTPVRPRHSTVAMSAISLFAASNANSAATRVSAIGCASGISAAVRFAAWIAAIRATPSTSPFFAPPSTTVQGGGPHRDAARGDRDAVRFVLAAHVHHVRAPLAVEMSELRGKLTCQVRGLRKELEATGRYHKRMRFPAWLVRVSLALLPALAFVPAFVPSALAQFQSQLPDLGDNGASELPPQAERRIGETVMRDIRRDPAYLDDPEIAEYLNGLAARLTEGAPPGARQDFELFAIKDSTINAFALPGGYIGVHTGLISASDNESEMASVLAHEMAHVTQRHIARQLGLQKQMQMPMLIATAAALLFARSRPDLAGGAAIAAQGAAIQSQLAFNRDFEREADRIGFQTLAGSGFDVRAMAV